ncbi:hypothetical protein T484DRAFT_1778387 [Baffinella frigidus]|nr:hypothetical protein T484DRAFT_1778387 [Cryptophyta sp. CCMP2293]
MALSYERGSLGVLTRAPATPLAFLHTTPRLPAPARSITRPTSLLWTGLACALSCSATAGGAADAMRRKNGVIITYDPYAPGMADKYGAPGKTDSEGFDPYRDSVGAGIYSGTVQRDEHGAVVIGKQYQNHNTRPGPVYSGGGYTPTAAAIASFRAQRSGGGGKGGETSLGLLLKKFPDLVNEVSTGGALPLHSCGMSRENQHAASFLISKGEDIEGVDTYGYTPLQIA